MLMGPAVVITCNGPFLAAIRRGILRQNFRRCPEVGGELNIGPSYFLFRDLIDIDRIYKAAALDLEHCQRAK